MLDDELNPGSTDSPSTASGEVGVAPVSGTPVKVTKRTRKAPAKKAAAVEPTSETTDEAGLETAEKPAKKAAVKKTTRVRATKKAAAEAPAEASTGPTPDGVPDGTTTGTPDPVTEDVQQPTPTKKRRASKKAAAAPEATVEGAAPEATVEGAAPEATAERRVTLPADDEARAGTHGADAAPLPPVPGGLVFQAPEAPEAAATPRRRRKAAARPESPVDDRSAGMSDGDASTDVASADTEPSGIPGEGASPDTSAGDDSGDDSGDVGDDSDDGPRRRRRRGGRRRRKAGDGDADSGVASDETLESDEAESDSPDTPSTRRRRRRRRSGDDGDTNGGDNPEKTAVRVRKQRSAEDEITAVSGSTRLEAKKQRRREGREAGRRRAPIVSEAEFLARREAVDRVMAIRQRDDVTQIAVLEDKVLVEHYVARESQTSLIGNVYLGRVQNVLPSMEAAFVDIGKGRNAVLYAGEVNWSALGHKDGQPRKIESVLSSGQPVLVQVTKDPVGHKGARLTSQISLAGRFLVYVPDGTTSGISRKLPDTERNRLKALLKDIVPDTAGVIVRTAAEGAAEDELTRDVERLKARWDDIEKKSKGTAPQLLYGEPDLTLKVVRDLFTEDFVRLVVDGDDAWDTVQSYVAHVAPDLEARLERHDRDGGSRAGDLFSSLRIDEQIYKGLDRKVWLPSGGSLVIDRTEAMTVVDVNTGKFTGSGGNLEETVTKNNLEAAEEIVRQLRLRDIGGIIVVDFIDMVLESNRDLVLRRLVECLGRDRTRHQVAEVTSLGLVQMTRKRIGTGLLEAFSESCEHCKGRGVIVRDTPVEPRRTDDLPRGVRGGRRGRGRGDDVPSVGSGTGGRSAVPSPRDVASMARPENVERLSPDLDAGLGELTDGMAEPPGTTEPSEVPLESAVHEAAGVVELAEVAAERHDPEAAVPEPADVHEPAPPAATQGPPRVVTRTRRRAASRPAGPPVSTSGGGAAPHTAVSNGTAPPDGELVEVEAGHVEHVPVKKKGTRKR